MFRRFLIGQMIFGIFPWTPTELTIVHNVNRNRVLAYAVCEKIIKFLK